MKKLDFKKDILPHLVAVIIFLILTFIFFKPSLIDGKSLNQSDIVQWQASAQELVEYRAETGEEGLWTNSIFGGMPAYLISVKWGNQLIKTAHAIYTLGLPHPVRIIFACMLSFYIMLLCFGVRPYVAIIGAIAFGLSSYNMIGMTAGHNARISAVSFMPLVMGGIHLCFNKYKWLGMSLTALALAMQMRVNHLQITYYLAFIVGIYGIVQLIYAAQENRLPEFGRRLGLLVIAAIMAVGTFFGEFYATYEYGKYSNRGKSELTNQTNEEMNTDGLGKTYAFQYSNGIWDPFTLFIPNALGGNGPFPPDGELAMSLKPLGVSFQQIPQLGIQTYWGKESPTTYYAGAIMIFLLVVGFFVVDKKYLIWLITVAVLGILFSYGRNLPSFNNFMFDYFPGYNKFRSVTFTMVMPIFSFALIGCLVLEKIFEERFKAISKKQLAIAFGITGGLALFLAVGSGALSYRSDVDRQLSQLLAEQAGPQVANDVISGIRADRQGIMQADAFRSFAFIALFGLTLYLLLIDKISSLMASAGMTILMVADTGFVSSRFMSEGNFSTNYNTQSFALSAADQSIKNNESPGDRVLDLTKSFYNGIPSYHHHLINGYHGARVRRYQEIIDNKLLDEYSNIRNVIQSGSQDFSAFPIINMLNTKFLIVNPGSASGALINNSASGSAWFAEGLVFSDDADAEFSNTLSQPDLRSKAVVRSDEVSASQGLSNGTITLVESRPGYWKYETSNTGDGFAVFSEVYYPKGFEVTVDGEEVEMTHANYILRGLPIPSGSHVVEFKFAPKIYTSGTIIMSIMSILVLAGFLFTVYLNLKKS